MAGSKELIGQTLVQMGMISHEQLDRALLEQKHSQQKLGRILIQRKLLSERQFMEVLSESIGVPCIQISQLHVEPDVLSLVPADLIYKHRVFPVQLQDNTLVLAMHEPFHHQVIEEIQMATGLNVNPVLAGEKELDAAIRNCLTPVLDSHLEKILQQLKAEPRAASLDEHIITGAFDDAPIIKVVDAALKQAVRDKASDIHFEPRDSETRIRFRIDGLLNTVFTTPKEHHPALVSRIKIMGSMDIAEKRTPQDGRFSLTIDQRQVDFRASTLPVLSGEKVVLRILDRNNALTSIEELGLSRENYEKLWQLALRPHGMVLVTGPTGSGKTTTLYSMLNAVNSAQKNIVTLEDPIEYSLEGVNQVQINPRAKLTFARGLRACFRQDPDIMMVGEIRDRETAELAVQAALTGHVVFSTLHTSGAVGAITRLTDMGVEQFLLGSCLAGVIAQRLVRQLCGHCRKSFILDQETACHLGIEQLAGKVFYQAVGCPACRQQGYQGRIAIQEVLVLNRKLRSLINRADFEEASMLQEARCSGFTDIKEDGIAKALKGLTTLEEVMQAVLWKE